MCPFIGNLINMGTRIQLTTQSWETASVVVSTGCRTRKQISRRVLVGRPQRALWTEWWTLELSFCVWLNKKDIARRDSFQLVHAHWTALTNWKCVNECPVQCGARYWCICI